MQRGVILAKSVNARLGQTNEQRQKTALKTFYNLQARLYNGGSKVDGARQVLRLGKSVDERAHLPCGASFGPLPKFC